MQEAVRQLTAQFPGICLSPLLYTEPVGCVEAAVFLNGVAILETSLTADELTAAFKAIECRLGRKPEDKGRGVVPIDIDLLMWDDFCLRPEEMARTYVRSALLSLLAKGEDDEGGKGKAYLIGGSN